MTEISNHELLEMYRATLALKELHRHRSNGGSYENYYEKRCAEIETEILRRMK